MMAVFNNLVMYRPARGAEQPATRSCPISPPSWSWSEDGTELTFPLRQGVKWHDGKPFTAADVKCTWDLLHGHRQRQAAGQPAQGLVQQCRGGHDQRRLRGHLPPEAAAAGACWRCSPRAGRRSIRATCRRARCASIRSAPARSNSSSSSRTNTSRSTRNPDYWKPGRPYLDGIEYTIMRETATAHPGLLRRQVRRDSPYGVTIPLTRRTSRSRRRRRSAR